MPGGWNLVLYYSYFPRYLLSIHIYSQSFEYIQADFVKMPASFPQPSINPMWSVHLGLDQNPFLAFDYPPRYSFHDSSASQENVNTNNDNDNGNDQTRTEDETPGRSRRHRDHASRTRHRRGHRNRQQTSAGPGTGEGRPPRVGLPFSDLLNPSSLAASLFQRLTSQAVPGAVNNRLLEQFWHNYQRTWNSYQNQVDFTPRVDVFSTPEKYTVHISLPGAKKENINVHYEPSESTLQVHGVVLRPGSDEGLNSALVLDERREEAGAFEREIRLGEKEPANVDVGSITARLADGVLVVTLPRVPGEKKKVVVEDGGKGKDDGNAASASASSSDAAVAAVAATPGVPGNTPAATVAAAAPPYSASVQSETEKGDAEEKKKLDPAQDRGDLTPVDSEESDADTVSESDDGDDGGREFVKVNIEKAD